MIEFSNNQEIYNFKDEFKSLIDSAVFETLKFEGFKYNYEISVVITDNSGIKKINHQFRNIDRETDVLSFPMIEFDKKNMHDQAYQVSEDEINPENGNVMLGDIVISIEKAYEQAREYGHSIDREIAFLTVHSTLHLLGYDHMQVEDEKVMINKQKAILAGMNLSR